MYESEVSDYKEKIDKMKAEKMDSYDIKKKVRRINNECTCFWPN